MSELELVTKSQRPIPRLGNSGSFQLSLCTTFLVLSVFLVLYTGLSLVACLFLGTCSPAQALPALPCVSRGLRSVCTPRLRSSRAVPAAEPRGG